MVIALLVVGSALTGSRTALRALGWANVFTTNAFLALISCLSYAVVVRVVESRRVDELDVRSFGRQFCLGALTGAALFGATVAVLWLSGLYHILETNPWRTVLTPLAISISTSVIEETLLRGIVFRMLEEWLGSWLSLASSALLFGFLHLGNPNATPTSALAIALEAGVLLAAAFMVTRKLWFPIGIHFAWNFTQGGIFGIAVSGTNPNGLIRAALSGPVLFSGGKFGAEASIVAVAICLAAGIYLIAVAKRTGQVVQPSWTPSKAGRVTAPPYQQL
jgi:uncharacterized protein